MSASATSLASIRLKLEDAEVEMCNEWDDRIYTWVPNSSISEIFQDQDEILKAILEGGGVMRNGMKGFMFKDAKTLVSLLIRFGHIKWLNIFQSNKFGNTCFPIKFRQVKTSNSWTWTITSSRSDKMFSFEVTAKETNAGFLKNSEAADAVDVYEEMQKTFDAGKKGQDFTWMKKDGTAGAASRRPPTITSTVLLLAATTELPDRRNPLRD
ncbi:hypothetical protein BDP81DRAFT_400842 [Colletotrichum phormii]|uniref:Uncharacterized protein n=1 Tax=Colletotrichum phormii TaxID=359342 RepID=A0AAI9ZCC5_9PEZI|nr:uncharacterized protein BDP81DRAFT_400842 [Colletotrichum phormii]KAK1621821.1 hypothetical protein BDP81DRAFT_400842 [Colletotrichum phormii]